MINSEELLFTVDENNEQIEPQLRSVVHANGIWHRTTDIWVYNARNQLLCHKRSMLKDSSPGLWDTTFGGHVLSGEESIDNALNELKEEAGITAAREKLELIKITRDDLNNRLDREFRYNYLYEWDGDIDELELEVDEVEEAAWFDIQDLRRQRESEPNSWTHPPQIREILDIIENRAY